MKKTDFFRRITDPNFLVEAATEFVANAEDLHNRKARIILEYQRALFTSQSMSKREIREIFGKKVQKELVHLIEMEEKLFRRFFRHFKFLTEERNQNQIIRIAGNTKEVRAAFEMINDLSELLKGHLFRESELLLCIKRQKQNAKENNFKLVIQYFMKELVIYKKLKEPLQITESLAPIILREIDIEAGKEMAPAAREQIVRKKRVISRLLVCVYHAADKGFSSAAASFILVMALLGISFVGTAQAAPIAAKAKAQITQVQDVKGAASKSLLPAHLSWIKTFKSYFPDITNEAGQENIKGFQDKIKDYLGKAGYDVARIREIVSSGDRTVISGLVFELYQAIQYAGKGYEHVGTVWQGGANFFLGAWNTNEVDCDTLSIVVADAANQLGIPLRLYLISGHCLLSWNGDERFLIEPSMALSKDFTRLFSSLREENEKDPEKFLKHFDGILKWLDRQYNPKSIFNDFNTESNLSKQTDILMKYSLMEAIYKFVFNERNISQSLKKIDKEEKAFLAEYQRERERIGAELDDLKRKVNVYGISEGDIKKLSELQDQDFSEADQFISELLKKVPSEKRDEVNELISLIAGNLATLHALDISKKCEKDITESMKEFIDLRWSERQLTIGVRALKTHRGWKESIKHLQRMADAFNLPGYEGKQAKGRMDRMREKTKKMVEDISRFTEAMAGNLPDEEIKPVDEDFLLDTIAELLGQFKSDNLINVMAYKYLKLLAVRYGFQKTSLGLQPDLSMLLDLNSQKIGKISRIQELLLEARHNLAQIRLMQH
ncbi:MAG: hypothetical protein KKC75_08150 [Nanoarchaeota archaeon]|nr:hypothetical protein [Nanoarchaeota archaeon]